MKKKKKQRQLWMNIADKVPLDKCGFGKNCKAKRCCPAHYWPHVMPFFQDPVTDEPCHTHEAAWRRAHHNFFCRILKCPNYKFMRKESKKKGYE
ncbi:hypothetical protein HOG48_03640 [Candidatus Peregrinibacteria bacterium]|nr:hypothetical protein [Candidatus Peregrinibacteria bacterium]